MKRFVTGIIISCGLILTGGIFAQDRDHDRDDRGYQDNRGYWDTQRMSREYRGAFYDRLQGDLSRAESSRYLRGEDLSRFDRAHREVSEFQNKWSRGQFDPREMDEAIGAVQQVVSIPSLRDRDRENLREDLAAMRRFRAHIENRMDYRR